MNTRLLSTLFLSALSLTQLSHAQISPDLAQGLSPYAVYQAGAIDNVNPASGNLFLQIPLISYPQRGGDLRLSFYIFSNDKQWYISDYNGSCGVGSNQTCGSWAGANFIQGDTTQPAVGAYVARDQMVVFGWDDAKTVTQVAGCSPPGCAVTTDLYGFYVKSADGAKHYIGDQQNQTCTMGSCTVPLYSNIRNRYPAVDGSGFTPVTVPDFGPGGEVVDINGTHYTPTTVTDRNGNFITSSNSGWTDTLSRPIPGSAAGPGSQLSPTEPIPGVPSANALGHCPSGTISGREWDVPASLGYHSGTASYYLCYSNFNYSTNFDLNGTFGVTYYNVPESSSTDPNNIPALLLSAVVLPNGTQYTFSYEQQDLSLSQITLPTGGTISYEWQNIPFNLSTTAPISRALKKRTVSPGGGQPQQVWTYYWHKTLTTTPPYVPVYPIISVVTDPEGNDQERTLGGKDDAGNQTYQSLTPTKVQFYQGCGPDNDSPTKRCSPGAGTLLKTESYILGVYGSNGADVPTPPEQSALVYKPTTTTTTWGGGPGSVVTKSVVTQAPGYESCSKYDGLGTVGNQTPPALGNPIPLCYSSNQNSSIAYYDYGQGAPGPLLRTDSVLYKWQDSNAPAYLASNLLSLIKSETHVGGGSSMETDYSYDEPAYATATGIGTGTQHAGPPGTVRGNATTVSQVSNNGTSPTTHTLWFDTGVPSWTQDANQSANTNLGKTTYTYSAAYAGAFPITVANGLSQPTNYSYDLNLGLKTSVQDANGQTIAYSYADPLGRLTDVLYPNVYPGTGTKGETTYHYNDSTTAPSVTVTMKVNPTATEQIEEDVDGVGRLIATKTTDGSAVDQVDTNYDANGHVASVSNPHRLGAPFSSDGTTGYTYDALGRMLTKAQPDVGVQQWTYSGQAVDFLDETSRHWRRVSDGLGRLITVFEPDASDNPTIGTQYQYDGNGNLLHVDQTGGGSGFGGDRVRTFSYDSLSRLVAAQNPENLSATNQANLTCPGATGGPWTTCYGYDPNGNLTSKIDNRNVTTTYGYDALNRLKSKTYTNDPNNTPLVTMAYDSIANGVNTVGRLVQEYTGPSAAPLTQRTITQYDPMGRVQQENQCIMGSCATGGHTLQYSYDLAGNLYTETNGVASPAIALTYGYDAVNRLVSVTNNYTQDAQHPTTLFSATGYGPVGLLNASLGVNSLSSVTAVTRTLTYDSRQRILTDTENGHPNLPPTATISGSEGSYFVCTSGNCRSHTDGGTLTVTVNGFAATATYAAGSTSATVAQSLTNALNGSGSPVHAALSGLTITMSGASSYTMSTSGTVTEGGCNQSCHSTPDFVATLAGGVANGTLYSYALNTAGGATPGYAPNGNVIGFTDSVQGQWGFGYDNVNRMTSGIPTAGPYNGLTFVWGYDPFGNRKSQTVSGSSQTTIQSTPTFSFIGSPTNHVDNGSYDAMGNMTHDQLNSYAYDAEGRLCAVAPQAGGATGYLYDAEGQRWAKGSIGSLSCNFSSNGFAATSTYLLGPAGEQLTELNGAGGWVHTNVFAAGSLLATYDSLGTHFALADWLGTKRIQASATGGIDETCMSLPFGDSLTCMGPDATEHHFTGKEHDIESGNDFFLARYSGGTMGRFMSPDSVFATVDRLADPQQWNMYSYVRNNPLSIIDPSGLDFNLTCSQNNGSTCVGGLQGQTIDGKFQATDVDMNKTGDAGAGYHDQFGNQYTGSFDQNSGVSFTNTASGATSSNSRFIDGSDQTDVNGSGSIFGGTQGRFNSNCGGSCEAKGSLYDLSGHAGAVANAEKMIGRSFEDNLNFFGGHGKSISFRTGEDQLTHVVNHLAGPDAGRQEIHFEGHAPGRDLTNFVLHQVDAIRDSANNQSAQEPRLP